VIDYEDLANNVEAMREIMRALVAGLVADGFTDEQARAIVTEMVTKKDDDE